MKFNISVITLFLAISCGNNLDKTQVNSKFSAVINDNLIYGCKNDGFANYDCFFKEEIIAPIEAHETTFVFEYQFEGCGGEITKLGLSDERGFHNFPATQGKKKITLNSKGNLSTKNYDPVEFRRGFFWNGCKFIIYSVSKSPSSNTIEKWKSEKEKLENELKNIELGINATANIVLLLPAFELMKTIIDQLSREIINYTELRNQFCKLTDCFAIEPAEESLLGKLIESNEITFSEKLALLELHEIAVKMPLSDDVEACLTESVTSNECVEILQNSVIPNSLKDILTKIAESLLSAEEAQRNFESLSRELIRVKNEIDKLKSISINYIVW